MTLKERLKDPSLLYRIGSASLAAAILTRWLATPAAGPTRDLVDGAIGFATGVALATLVLAAWLGGRRRGSSNASRGA
jgi:hypothetical protein